MLFVAGSVNETQEAGHGSLSQSVTWLGDSRQGRCDETRGLDVVKPNNAEDVRHTDRASTALRQQSNGGDVVVTEDCGSAGSEDVGEAGRPGREVILQGGIEDEVALDRHSRGSKSSFVSFLTMARGTRPSHRADVGDPTVAQLE